jgi:hypothetical protein
MSSIIRLDAVEVLGVGLNTSSSLTWNPTERPQDKSADPGRAHVVVCIGFVVLSVALLAGPLRQFPNDFSASRAIASAARTACSDD